MTDNDYQPENHEWLAVLTVPGDRVGSDGRPRPVGVDPMAIPVDVLTDAGHPPRSTRVLVNAIMMVTWLILGFGGIRISEATVCNVQAV